jgi:hypothetical protein
MNSDRNILDRISREEPYKVPEGYFDDLYSNILANKEEKHPVSAAWWKSPVLRWSLVPAAIVLLLLMIPVFNPLKTNTTNTTAAVASSECLTVACLTDDELNSLAAEFDLVTLEEFSGEDPADSLYSENIDLNEDELIDELLESEL